MMKTTQKALRALIAMGAARDITRRPDRVDGLRIIAYSLGIYGVNGLLMINPDGDHYAIVGRTSSIFYYL